MMSTQQCPLIRQYRFKDNGGDIVGGGDIQGGSGVVVVVMIAVAGGGEGEIEGPFLLKIFRWVRQKPKYPQP